MNNDYIKLANHALWVGNFKRGTTVKTLLPDLFKAKDDGKKMTKEKLAKHKEEVNKVMPPLNAVELMKLKRKIKEKSERK